MAFPKKTGKGKQAAVIEATEVATVKEAIKDLTLEKALSEANRLTIAVSKTLGNLSGQITEGVNQVDTLQKAKAILEGELESLHNIKAGAVTLDELEAQIAQQREELNAERDARQAEWQTEDEEREQERLREEEEYSYNLNLARRTAETAYRQQQEDLARSDKLKREEQDRQWTAREAALKAAEQELTDLRNQAKSFEARVAGEVQRRTEKVSAELTAQNNVQIQLLTAKSDQQAAIQAAEIKSLQEALKRSEARNTALEQQITATQDRAAAQVREALNAASGQSALRVLQESLQTQAGAPQTGKGGR